MTCPHGRRMADARSRSDSQRDWICVVTSITFDVPDQIADLVAAIHARDGFTVNGVNPDYATFRVTDTCAMCSCIKPGLWCCRNHLDDTRHDAAYGATPLEAFNEWSERWVAS